MSDGATSRSIDARHLLDALPHPVLAIENEHVIFANASAEDFFCVSAASLARLRIGRHHTGDQPTARGHRADAVAPAIDQ